MLKNWQIPHDTDDAPGTIEIEIDGSARITLSIDIDAESAKKIRTRTDAIAVILGALDEMGMLAGKRDGAGRPAKEQADVSV